MKCLELIYCRCSEWSQNKKQKQRLWTKAAPCCGQTTRLRTIKSAGITVHSVRLVANKPAFTRFNSHREVLFSPFSAWWENWKMCPIIQSAFCFVIKTTIYSSWQDTDTSPTPQPTLPPHLFCGWPVVPYSRGHSISIQRGLPSRRHGAAWPGHGRPAGALPHRHRLPHLPLGQRKRKCGQNMWGQSVLFIFIFCCKKYINCLATTT